MLCYLSGFHIFYLHWSAGRRKTAAVGAKERMIPIAMYQEKKEQLTEQLNPSLPKLHAAGEKMA